MKTRTLVIFLVLAGAGGFAYLLFRDSTLKDPVVVESFSACVAAGYETIETTPRECHTPDGQVFTETPSDNPNDSPEGQIAEKPDLIRVTSPRIDAEVGSPLTIAGEARGNWFFEASFPVKLLDANGKEVALNPPYIMATGEWMTEAFVPFEAELSFTPPSTETGTLVLMKDNPSGLPQNDNELRIPVRFNKATSGETTEVLVYFSNPRLSPGAELDCALVEPVKRTVPKTEAVARAALTELLKGPTASERAAGYVSAIPAGAVLKAVTVEDGTAMADFSEDLEPGGGSCAVTAIRAQISETLTQFNSVSDVTISVNGETEEILQP